MLVLVLVLPLGLRLLFEFGGNSIGPEADDWSLVCLAALLVENKLVELAGNGWNWLTVGDLDIEPVEGLVTTGNNEDFEPLITRCGGGTGALALALALALTLVEVFTTTGIFSISAISLIIGVMTTFEAVDVKTGGAAVTIGNNGGAAVFLSNSEETSVDEFPLELELGAGLSVFVVVTHTESAIKEDPLTGGGGGICTTDEIDVVGVTALLTGALGAEEEDDDVVVIGGNFGGGEFPLLELVATVSLNVAVVPEASAFEATWATDPPLTGVAFSGSLSSKATTLFWSTEAPTTTGSSSLSLSLSLSKVITSGSTDFFEAAPGRADWSSSLSLKSSSDSTTGFQPPLASSSTLSTLLSVALIISKT
ncbi:hypothetical protein WICPIJ_006485 [Wickerhamomyces pijperi]|uniref:Uncharacterized protein n=1 Tax=Wickerhamomyces pijperi TaxID=599730 RepID=A0A9P8TKY1_WICPI|nr:hypothetical protein WICPIJ_006485 [Wickerhamomyces pijperi]